MEKQLTEDMLLDCYQALYESATPKADFKKMVEECCRYIDKDCSIHITEQPLPIEELQKRGWYKDIQYMNHEIDEDTYEQIVKSKIKENGLTGIQEQKFVDYIYNGCGPRIIKK
jgi:hypothetical protein